jgi:hypothetical protein
VILGRDFARALEQAGVVSDLNSIERIVIDVRADDMVRVHVQRLGDERLIDLAALLAGAGD